MITLLIINYCHAELSSASQAIMGLLETLKPAQDDNMVQYEISESIS